jgi:hypothetical protein
LFDGTESATFTVQLQITLGCGQAMAQFSIPYTLAPTSGVYLPVYDQKFLPAQDIQVGVSVQGTANATSPGKDTLLVGLFVAPQTEPHAMTMVLDKLDADDERRDRWMREGFNPEHLQYGR